MKRIEVMRKEHPEKVKQDGTVMACIEEYGFKGKEYCSKKHEMGIGYMQKLRCKICWLHKSRRWKEEFEKRRRDDVPETNEEEKEKGD